jgi:hypothetical protein
MVDAVHAEIRSAGDGWRQVLRSLVEATRQAAHQHEWFADLIGGRPQLGPHTLASGEAVAGGQPGINAEWAITPIRPGDRSAGRAWREPWQTEPGGVAESSQY